MLKWWLLLVILLGWIALGYALFPPQYADVMPGTPDSQTPARIVSMAPNLTEILYALGLDENVVGVTRDSDYPPSTAQKPNVGTFWQPNIEAVIAVKPDLIVTLTTPQQRNLADRLKRMGYGCLTLDTWKVNDLFNAITTVGKATGTEEQADRLLSDIKGKIETLQAAMVGKDNPKVLWVVQREPLRVAGRNTFLNELIELAGGENAIGPTFYKYPPIGGEQVITSGAEVIIEPAMLPSDRCEQRAQAISYWSKFANLPAVANNRIYIIDGDTVSRLGPRLYEGIETVAECIRPEAFGE